MQRKWYRIELQKKAMNIANHNDNNSSLKEKVLYLLSILKKATADEVAMEIMELQGNSTEEGVRQERVRVRRYRVQKEFRCLVGQQWFYLTRHIV
jgi:hypothetical protein